MTAPRIRILDEQTINQIAAGEVIENPASVVKELIENALDAGATEIELMTQAAGRGLIRVSDNGHGMGSDDLLLALERHATSKLSNTEDLASIKTLGFRGEALPSIAAVSKMRLHSARENGTGSVLSIEGGCIGVVNPLPRMRGTTIEVRSLFFNTPVRKKFQKNPSSDLGDLSKVMTKSALCYPTVGLRWINDEEKKFNFLPFTPFGERVKELLGIEFSEFTLPLDFRESYQGEEISLSGCISSPYLHRPNRVGQYLFINRRAVDSTWFGQHVLSSYATRLPPNRYPLFVIHLKLPQNWIDVNVHPQKREIKIYQEDRVAQWIQEGIGKTLAHNECAQEPPAVAAAEIVFLPSSPLIIKESSFSYKSPSATLWSEQSATIMGRISPYLLLQEQEGIRLFHCDHARERIIYETLHVKREKQEIQHLLIPIQLQFHGKQEVSLNAHLGTLNEIGLSIRPFGGHTYIVDAIPSILEREEIADLIDAFLEEGTIPKKVGQCIKRTPCRREMENALVQRLFACSQSEFTPDGKRIHTLITTKHLDKILKEPFPL